MIAALYLDGRLMLDELVSATAPLGEFGKVVINLIKALAVPLLFFAVLDALSNAAFAVAVVQAVGAILLIAS